LPRLGRHGGVDLMSGGPSPDVMPVANPELREGKRRRMVRDVLAEDPSDPTEPLYQLRRRDQVVAPSSLDGNCRQLLHRAQAAIGSARDSGADHAGLPDIVTEGTLRQHEWEIAVVLRDITDLRAEHELNAAESAGPMTSAVLESHQRAVQLALDAISSRVTALERYAAEIGATAAAYLDWQEAMRVAEMNDRYLDLVARTAADEHAVAEIGGLTEQATAAAQAFRDTVGQMSQAAAALALPEPDAG
jgi:hypothetical protein